MADILANVLSIVVNIAFIAAGLTAIFGCAWLIKLMLEEWKHG